MKFLILTFISLFFIFQLSFSQDQTADSTQVIEEKVEDKPVRSTFESGILIDNQTTRSNSAGTLEMIIDHRFGNVNKGITDLFGIYAPSNIMLGLNYSPTDKILLGIGTTKNNKLQDIQWKYQILQQTRSGKIPVNISYYGNAVIDASNESNFGAKYKFIHRFSYFNELMISRKFNNMLSLQIAGGVVHFNSVDSAYNNDNAFISLLGRVKFTPQTSVIFELEQATLNNPGDMASKPNAALGFEISTSTHAFQLFVTSYGAIMNQHNIQYNANDFTKGQVMIGFNITRKWNF